MILLKNIRQYFHLMVLIGLLASCEKVDITFVASAPETDPNITYLDNFETSISTYLPDSFVTSSHQVISLGYHYDSVFGVVSAGSYAQISLPLSNPVANVVVVFDSLELIIQPSGEFYGDSTRPIKINVYRLTQNITDTESGDAFYNTASFNYNPVTIGRKTINLTGKTGTPVHIKLSDALGQELLTKFKTNDDDISGTEKFIDYFKGIYINTDSVVTNSLAYFSAPSDSTLIRLTYHENTLYSEKKNAGIQLHRGKAI